MSLRRLDQILLDLHPGESRNRIRKLIEEGGVQWCDSQGQWKVLSKPGVKFEKDDFTAERLKLQWPEILQYVSRSALKLKGALEYFRVECENLVALDVGQSTGGFTQVLLEAGCARVLGVDVGQGQLAPSLRNDKRVLGVDKVNMRNPLPEEVLRSFFNNDGEKFDLIVIDVSFISQELIVPNLIPLLKPDGRILTLVKPQFESQPGDLNDQGVVTDLAVREKALQKVSGIFQRNGLQIIGSTVSSVEGENGNAEYLLLGSLS